MRGKTGLIIGFSAVLVIVLAISILSYRVTIDRVEDMQIDYENRVSEQVEVEITKAMSEKAESMLESALEDKNDSLAVEETPDTLTVETIYQIQSYDVVKDTTTTDYETLPEELVGYTRADADEYFKDYMDSLSVEEYLAGLQSMGVVSFSPDRLVVKKIYDSSKIAYKYYLIAVEGEVVVYYGDRKNVYEYTGIETEKLSKEEQKKLKNGIEVKDEKELFNILENYSS